MMTDRGTVLGSSQVGCWHALLHTERQDSETSSLAVRQIGTGEAILS